MLQKPTNQPKSIYMLCIKNKEELDFYDLMGVFLKEMNLDVSYKFLVNDIAIDIHW